LNEKGVTFEVTGRHKLGKGATVPSSTEDRGQNHALSFELGRARIGRLPRSGQRISLLNLEVSSPWFLRWAEVLRWDNSEKLWVDPFFGPLLRGLCVALKPAL
jgi:hypothetical protein